MLPSHIKKRIYKATFISCLLYLCYCIIISLCNIIILSFSITYAKFLYNFINPDLLHSTLVLLHILLFVFYLKISKNIDRRFDNELEKIKEDYLNEN